MKRIAIVLVCIASSAEAKQTRPEPIPRPHPPCSDRARSDCELPRLGKPRTPPEKTININDPLSLGGKLHGMSLLYFIERANEELERSTLPTKSFVPRLVQSVEEEAL